MDENNENPPIDRETLQTFRIHPYFEKTSPDEWEVISFHRFRLEQNKSNLEELVYPKAAQQLIKNLQCISETSRNVDKVPLGCGHMDYGYLWFGFLHNKDAQLRVGVFDGLRVVVVCYFLAEWGILIAVSTTAM
ncbi:11069_t:CDS:2 [Paraglomus brasilianum]|uniref:11069_t:CDS:1 n=1 Tax=Paraglomus brasilianum TaxID=144538 RepID=A0A9N9CYC2_9GLOM|nr:11069_t:CDS:2 [Paraglomus brasilianum]